MKLKAFSSLALDVIGTCPYVLEQPPAVEGSAASKIDARGLLVAVEPVVSTVHGRIVTKTNRGDQIEARGAVFQASAKLVTRQKIVIPGDANDVLDRLPLVTGDDGTKYRIHAPDLKGCVYVYPLERYKLPEC